MTKGQYQRLLEELVQMNRRIDETNGRIGQTNEKIAQTNERIDQTNDETRRYFGVVAEGLRQDIRQVAEGLMGLDERFEAARRENAAEHALIRKELRLAFGNLDRRVSALEKARNN